MEGRVLEVFIIHNLTEYTYFISDQWPVTSGRLENRHAESRKIETYIHGGAGNSGMWVLLT